jgi:rubrerythrin
MVMGTHFEDFITFAIEQEVKAATLYEKYAGIVESRTARQLLGDMAAMERGHEAKLTEFKSNGRMLISKLGVIADLHIAEFLVDTVIGPTSTVEEVFVFAMKAEEKAATLYARLAALEESGVAKTLFSSLAGEEKKHKYDLEQEYERMFMIEN